MSKKENTHLVYSTEKGRIKKLKNKGLREPTGDGVIRIRREVKGRGGKTVTTITGIPHSEANLKELATELKRRCGTGGSVKSGTIIIQGDHRESILEMLKEKGYQVKLAGG